MGFYCNKFIFRKETQEMDPFSLFLDDLYNMYM